MQYVGRFVSSVYNTITPNINPATLSGAIDVIVVERQVEKEVEEEDGSGRKKKVMVTELASTPFHVRFGKMSVLRPAERKVTLHLNNSPDPLPFAMKVGEAGEAFFVLELNQDEARQGIPEELVTSPILSATTSPTLPPNNNEGLERRDLNRSASESNMQLTDSHQAPRKLIAENYVEPLDLGASRASTSSRDNNHDFEGSETGTVRSGETRQSQDTALTSPSLQSTAELEKAPSEKEAQTSSRPSSRSGNSSGGAGVMENIANAASKASGVLGAAGSALSTATSGVRNAKLEKMVSSEDKKARKTDDVETGADVDSKKSSAGSFEPQKKSDAQDRLRKEDDSHPPDDIKEAQNATERLEVKMRDRTEDLLDSSIEVRKEEKGEARLSLQKTISRGDEQTQAASQHEEAYPAPFGGEDVDIIDRTMPTTQVEHEHFLDGRRVDRIDSGIEGREPVDPAAVDVRVIAKRLEELKMEKESNDEENGANVQKNTGSRKVSKDNDEIPVIKSSRKEALQYMLDMDGYKMTTDGEDLAYAEGTRLANEVPISKRHGMSESTSALPSLQAHRRGSFSDVESKALPSEPIIDDIDLGETSVTKRRGSFSGGIASNEGNAAEDKKLLLDLAKVSDQGKDDTLNNFTLQGQDFEPSHTLPRTHTDSVLDIKDGIDGGRKATEDDLKVPKRSLTSIDQTSQQKTYAKTLRLTSDQLKSLNLHKGTNSITFSVTSSYSGVATCAARIFLWDSTHRVVVSDIDGTITKSDALGHVFTMIGRDWTHSGVAKLYTDIARNGYRIMYLTSRAIGQADTTRDYLRGINQNNFRLPDGPVIMSPDRLMASLHREVILRKPEVFKMACLRDIARLFGADPRTAGPQPGNEISGFPKNEGEDGNMIDHNNAGREISPGSGAATNQGNQPTPFYAGFGNRITDALSYRSVNIPSSRIFTIDSNGEVKMELLELAGYKSSYIHMTDLVDQMFPPITAKTVEGNAGKPEFNDFNFWRSDLGEFELPPDDDLTYTPVASSPVSPALSARSIRSVRSQKSIRSNASTTKLYDDNFVAAKGSAGTSNGKSNNGGGGTNGEEVQTSRLSRFGLGKLGLSRRGSNQTIPASNGQQDKQTNNASSSQSGPPTISGSPTTNSFLVGASPPSSPGSYGSGVTSWTAGWRRRATGQSQSQINVQATSPLVGPVISAEPDDLDDDDDVSSFGGEDRYEDEEGEEEGGDRSEEANGDQNEDQQGRNSRRRNRRQQDNMGDDVMDDDDDDPLLATGEIQFEWRG